MQSCFSLRSLLAGIVVLTAVVGDEYEPGEQNAFRNETFEAVDVLTTTFGSPVDFRDMATLNKRLIFNEFFMETTTHFVRERIPERAVHAKGAGGFGYFEVTHDLSDICKAKVFSTVGKKTPIAVRFSLVVSERGGSDTSRDARGFAVKFYTEDGNFDIVGLNLPVFVVNDPLYFISFLRSQKKHPATNLIDYNTFWDFFTLRPESLPITLFLFGDRGIPDGYRHMAGYGVHTFQVSNKRGEKFFIRFHFKPDAGIKNLSSDEAAQIAGEEYDYATRDLYKSISSGDFPSWTCYVQVLTENDTKTAGFDVFDVTKLLPLDKYPLRKFGRFVLNRNPVNYFAEIEQLAFDPRNLVPGIQGGPDKVFEARRLAYRDAQYHRLGANFQNIPVNCPYKIKTFTYVRDGVPPVDDNQKNLPSYFPNTFHGPMPYTETNRVDLIKIYQNDNVTFDQARDLYTNDMTPEEKDRLVENILLTLSSVRVELQDRIVKHFSLVDENLGKKIREGLQTN